MTHILIGISTPNAKIEDILRRHGAIPVLFENFSAESLDTLCGIILTGNEYDVPPNFYGEEPHLKTSIAADNMRLDFEVELINHAFNKSVPLLAICGGAQLLNVAFDGSLHQHIPDVIGDGIKHRQTAGTFHLPAHSIEILSETLLYTISGTQTAEINSNHHQAINKPGDGFIINATAPDGTIEGIEHTGHPFLLGVQWHPEFECSIIDDYIFAALVRATGDSHLFRK
jgi:putative glutamine amidotransferase